MLHCKNHALQTVAMMTWFPDSKLETALGDINRLMKADKDTLERLGKVDEELNSLRKTNNGKTTSNAKNSTIKTNSLKKQKFPPAENETLDHDILIIGDSNTLTIDMRKMAHGKSRKRVTCYTIPQTVHFLDTATIVRQPEKVLIHLGTNDVVGRRKEELMQAFDHMLSRARECFPNARI